MKDRILRELSSAVSKVQVVFATVAMGMGVDIPSIQTVIHVEPPRAVREYLQETGQTGHDGKLAHAVLYYNSHDIAKNREGVSDNICNFCLLEDGCLRKFLLNCLDAKVPDRKGLSHLCSSYCESVCKWMISWHKYCKLFPTLFLFNVEKKFPAITQHSVHSFLSLFKFSNNKFSLDSF